MAHPLFDKVALITGGSSGIGKSAAARLAGFGAKIAVASRDPTALAEAVAALRNLGTEAVAITTDVADAEQCRRAVESTVDRFGRLDILICSAGQSMRAYFDTCDLTALERVMHINFFGTMYMTHHAIPHVKKTRGSLVALSSLTGLRGIPSYGVYGASKFAIQGLYESLRMELHADGVHVGVLAPGFVDTPLRHRVLGPDGQPWQKPPPPPFRIWPVEKCVDRLIHLILKRKAQVNLPAYMGPVFLVDALGGRHVGDRILRRRFPRA